MPKISFQLDWKAIKNESFCSWYVSSSYIPQLGAWNQRKQWIRRWSFPSLTQRSGKLKSVSWRKLFNTQDQGACIANRESGRLTFKWALSPSNVALKTIQLCNCLLLLQACTIYFWSYRQNKAKLFWARLASAIQWNLDITKVTSKIRSQYRDFVIFLFHIFYHYVGKENR